jgi:hypothetical protein
VVARVHPVGIHCAQVLDLEFDEGLGEFSLIAEFDGKGVYSEVSQGWMGEELGNLPASNSYFRLRMFIRSLMTVSIGARASEKRMKPIMMGYSL